MPKEEKYTIILSKRSRINVKFSREKNKILNFAVNFEITYGKSKQWTTVIRYDMAHQEAGRKWKIPHKHTYYRNRKESIVFIRTKDYNEALTIAIKDIKNNFPKIKDKFYTY